MKRIFLLVIAFWLLCPVLLAAGVRSGCADPAMAEIRSVTVESNRSIIGTYRKIDDGKTPVILFFDGSTARSQDAALFRFEELSQYNLYCFNTTSPDGRSFDIANYRKAEDLRTQYADAVIQEVLRVFPDASEIGIVVYSNGGYAAEAICRAAASNGLAVCWFAGYDHIIRKEKAFLSDPGYIRTSGIPSLLGVSADQNKQITVRTADELKKHGSEYTLTRTYSARHTRLLSADGVSRDLAEFAGTYFRNSSDSPDTVPKE